MLCILYCMLRCTIHAHDHARKEANCFKIRTVILSDMYYYKNMGIYVCNDA